MSDDIYVYGSATRGEARPDSDVDVLVVTRTDGAAARYPHTWSVYHVDVLKEKYAQGRLFAWHLYLHARCIFNSNEVDELSSLGRPSDYVTARKDIYELRELFQSAAAALRHGSSSPIFELGICHTAIRDVAMSASWHMLDQPSFSRYSPYELPLKLNISMDSYQVAMSARHAGTRGTAAPRSIDQAVVDFTGPRAIEWINSLLRLI